MFTQFWKLYPARNGKKIGKGQCHKLFEKLSENDQGLCVIAAANYAKRQEWPVDPIRFFKSKDYPDGLWREWVEPEVVNGLERQGSRGAGRESDGAKSFHERNVSEAVRIREEVRARFGFSGRSNGLHTIENRPQVFITGRTASRNNEDGDIPKVENIGRDSKIRGLL